MHVSLSKSVRTVISSLAVVTLFLAVASPADALKFRASTKQKLSRTLNQAFAQTQSPGAIVSVSVGKRKWTAVRGSTRTGMNIRPRLSYHTRIGSVTKTFTGTLILQLVEKGRIRLGDTIDRWFPEVPLADQITVRDLGSMSSGINTYTANSTVVDQYLQYPRTVWQPSQLIAGGVDLPRKFLPGSGFQYSNTNFVMLGQIIEEVTGNPIAQVLKRRIFNPLDMNQTSYPSSLKLPTPFWNGYTDQGAAEGEIRNATNWSPTFESAAGQIVSTIGDIRRYTRALGTGSLLSPGTQRIRLQPNPFSVAGGRQYDFALGKDHGWLSHDGDVPGYNSQVAYLPKKRASIVIFMNTDNANSDGSSPAPSLLSALATVVSPNHVPTGSH